MNRSSRHAHVILWALLLVIILAGAGVLGWFALSWNDAQTQIPPTTSSPTTTTTVLPPAPSDEDGLRALSHDPAWLAKGKAIFEGLCWTCHGKAGEGGPQAPSLRDDRWISEPNMLGILTTIREGKAGTAMLPMKGMFSEQEIVAVAAYVADLHRHPGPSQRDPEGLNGPITW
jgi:mono/diheme cytochrome c family protein